MTRRHPAHALRAWQEATGEPFSPSDEADIAPDTVQAPLSDEWHDALVQAIEEMRGGAS